MAVRIVRWAHGPPARVPSVNDVDFMGILKRFPPMTWAFGYGSGVFRQSNHSSHNMIDLIFVVDDLERWHADNIARNPLDYSCW